MSNTVDPKLIFGVYEIICVFDEVNYVSASEGTVSSCGPPAMGLFVFGDIVLSLGPHTKPMV